MYTHIHLTTVFWPLYRTTCTSWHLELTTGGLCWCKVLLPACQCRRQPALEFSLTVLSTLSPYHTHTRLTPLCPGLPGWAGIRKVKPIWILLKQQTVSGSGISWAICKSAPRIRQITTPAPHHSVFYRPCNAPKITLLMSLSQKCNVELKTDRKQLLHTRL